MQKAKPENWNRIAAVVRFQIRRAGKGRERKGREEQVLCVAHKSDERPSHFTVDLYRVRVTETLQQAEPGELSPQDSLSWQEQNCLASSPRTTLLMNFHVLVLKSPGFETVSIQFRIILPYVRQK